MKIYQCVLNNGSNLRLVSGPDTGRPPVVDGVTCSPVSQEVTRELEWVLDRSWTGGRRVFNLWNAWVSVRDSLGFYNACLNPAPYQVVFDSLPTNLEGSTRVTLFADHSADRFILEGLRSFAKITIDEVVMRELRTSVPNFILEAGNLFSVCFVD